MRNAEIDGTRNPNFFARVRSKLFRPSPAAVVAPPEKLKGKVFRAVILSQLDSIIKIRNSWYVRPVDRLEKLFFVIAISSSERSPTGRSQQNQKCICRRIHFKSECSKWAELDGSRDTDFTPVIIHCGLIDNLVLLVGYPEGFENSATRNSTTWRHDDTINLHFHHFIHSRRHGPTTRHDRWRHDDTTTQLCCTFSNSNTTRPTHLPICNLRHGHRWN